MKYARASNHIMKDKYDDIIVSAKRKYNRIGLKGGQKHEVSD